MASENPNLQNIPVSSERGLAIREAFIPKDGYVFASFDYSQIELRIAAILSGDVILSQIFKDGRDVHTSVAAQVFKVPPEEVTKEMRRQAKVINFGILYGMGVNALRENLGTDRGTAQAFLIAYFENFKGVAEYLDKVKEEASRVGYTKTIFGRRRYFEGIKSKIPFIRAAAERMAINAPIQGTQADVIKIAMKRIDDFIKNEKLEGKVCLRLQIHDELVYEIEESVVLKVEGKIKDIMQDVLTNEQTGGVPIIANSAIGKNWRELK
jgi:DNA polymerase-1